jgi:hypothetical protein
MISRDLGGQALFQGRGYTAHQKVSRSTPPASSTRTNEESRVESEVGSFDSSFGFIYVRIIALSRELDTDRDYMT